MKRAFPTRRPMKFLGLLAVLVGAFLASSAPALAAAPCSVPSIAYPTIQAAVNDPNCNPINVAAGPYMENVVISRAVTLDGAQAGQPVGGRTSGGPLESTVTSTTSPVFMIKASNVTIDGFSVKDHVVPVGPAFSPPGSAVGIDVKSTVNGASIRNNIIDGVDTTDTTGNGTAQAVYLEAGPDNVSITGNELTNVHSNRSAKGVDIGDNGSTDPSTGVVISGNTISNITSDTRGAYGVLESNGAGHTANTGLQIMNNTISILNGGGWVHAIGFEANAPGALVLGNTISQLTAPSNTAIGVWFESEDTSFASSHVNRNSLDVGSSKIGMAVDPALPAGPVDGTCNWWGAGNGPGPVGSGSGSEVSANVQFTPWLTSSNLNGNCSSAMLNQGTTTCNGFFTGSGTDVVVPSGATCVLLPGSNVSHDVTVQQGGTLECQGATIGHDLSANKPAGIGIRSCQIGHDVHINGVTGNGPGVGGDNYICSSSIGHDVQIQNGAAGAGAFVIGDPPDCTGANPGNSIGHDLQVQNNADAVDVSHNSVTHDMQVQNNTGGTTVSNNSSGHDAQCQHNTPPASGSGNTAGHNNQGCPA